MQKNNIIPNSDDIWRPSIKVINSLSQNEFIEEDVTVTAKKYGSGFLNGDDVLLMDRIYNGNEINITRKSKLIGSFHCSFENLHLYPFDSETCTMDIQVVGNAYLFTKLIPKNIKYQGPQSLANYIIRGDNKFKRGFKNGKYGIEVEIGLSRKLTSIFMVTYLPTIVINIINQATNYFEGTIFSGDIVKVNLSSMMVLSALYISVSSSLPATASIKYVEIWLLFSFIYPFVIVLTQTFIQRNKVGKITPEKVTRVRVAEIIAMYLVPTCGVLFAIIYFWFGLYGMG